MLLVSGFNQFEQLNDLIGEDEASASKTRDNYVSKFIVGNAQDVKDICISWSNVMLVKENGISVSGFVNGEIVKAMPLEFPFEGSVVQASATRSKWLVVTIKGECWEFCANKWRPLSHMFPPFEYPEEHTEEEEDTSESYETSTDSSSSADQDGAVVRECCLNSVLHNQELDNFVDDEWAANAPSVTKILCGGTLTIGLTLDGLVYSLPNPLKFPGRIAIKDIACGIEHGIALTEDGRVFTWGCGTRGQLGLGTLENSEEPKEVEMLNGLHVSFISAGGWHSAVITNHGDVYTWGWNKQGQLGHPCIDSKVWEGKVGVLAEPRAVDFPQGMDVTVASVSCGTTHTVVKLDNGEIWGCGWNRWGQLGMDKIQFTDKMTKLNIPPGLNVNKIHCAAWNTVLFCEKTQN